jgi:5'-nucleotidase/UDP-sugar diphosphatase
MTMGDVYDLLPFGNQMVLFEITGAEIKLVLEEMLEVGYPYGAGIKFNVYMGNPTGERIHNIKINRRLENEWVSIELDTTYRMITTDFLADGGEGVAILPLISNRRMDLYFEDGELFGKNM